MAATNEPAQHKSAKQVTHKRHVTNVGRGCSLTSISVEQKVSVGKHSSLRIVCLNFVTAFSKLRGIIFSMMFIFNGNWKKYTNKWSTIFGFIFKWEHFQIPAGAKIAVLLFCIFFLLFKGPFSLHRQIQVLQLSIYFLLNAENWNVSTHTKNPSPTFWKKVP